jgi:hypothetical protein
MKIICRKLNQVLIINYYRFAIQGTKVYFQFRKKKQFLVTDTQTDAKQTKHISTHTITKENTHNATM